MKRNYAKNKKYFFVFLVHCILFFLAYLQEISMNLPFGLRHILLNERETCMIIYLVLSLILHIIIYNVKPLKSNKEKESFVLVSAFWYISEVLYFALLD